MVLDKCYDAGMCWRVYFLDKVSGDLNIISVFSSYDAWYAFISQARYSGVFEDDRYKSWIEVVATPSALSLQ